jgi:hypothetical protein
LNGLQFGETLVIKKNGCESLNAYPRQWVTATDEIVVTCRGAIYRALIASLNSSHDRNRNCAADHAKRADHGPEGQIFDASKKKSGANKNP